MRVAVEAYNPRWADQFLEIKHDLETHLESGQYISIEHVGSTSVIGLAAKPRIDVDIIVQKQHLRSVIEALQKAQYEPLGECGVPERFAFKAPETSTIPQNLYVCIEGCLSLRNHLMVRDLCRRDPEIRDLYGRTKLELSEREWVDIDAYCEAKNNVLAFILSKAGINREEAAQVRAANIVVGTGADKDKSPS